MPAHSRMRAYDRDLVRGGHYGQRSREPHKQAEHMAAPTNAANVKKALANGEPSTHGTKRLQSHAWPSVRFQPLSSCRVPALVTLASDPIRIRPAIGISVLGGEAKLGRGTPRDRTAVDLRAKARHSAGRE